jgi:hypothetical protein
MATPKNRRKLTAEKIQQLIVDLKTLMLETTTDREDRLLQRAMQYLSKAYRNYGKNPIQYKEED